LCRARRHEHERAKPDEEAYTPIDEEEISPASPTAYPTETQNSRGDEGTCYIRRVVGNPEKSESNWHYWNEKLVDRTWIQMQVARHKKLALSFRIKIREIEDNVGYKSTLHEAQQASIHDMIFSLPVSDATTRRRELTCLHARKLPFPDSQNCESETMLQSTI
jgi:hypothetical protein